jgi:hypothetical protein
MIPALAYFPQDLHPSIIGGIAFQDSVLMGRVGSTTLEKPAILCIKDFFTSVKEKTPLNYRRGMVMKYVILNFKKAKTMVCYSLSFSGHTSSSRSLVVVGSLSTS